MNFRRYRYLGVPCALCPSQYEAAASYYDNVNKEYKKPSFINSSALSFTPSTNLSPTEILPVLLWDENQMQLVIRPMIWGLIPPWTKGDCKSKLATHNCRVENMEDSRLFSEPLKKGKRCVVLCEGYYEWQTTLGKYKQPYFIYKRQQKGIKVEDVSQWIGGEWSKTIGWIGPSLTCLAGLYSTVDYNKGQEPTLSATIITMPSSQALSHIHSRMPVIFSTQEQILDWLHVEKIGMRKPFNNLLVPSEEVQWHEVSKEVNSSKNKSTDCNKPVNDRTKQGQQKSLLHFFKKQKEEVNDNEGTPSKRSKKE